MSRDWLNQAMHIIEADFKRSADTHLIKVDLNCSDISVYLKDESTHPTGSLKHRLARSLFLYALCNGQLREGMPVIEASSGSTAVSEAYFAKLLGLPFIAVIPKTTAKEKIRQIEFFGGQCHWVEHTDKIYQEAHQLAKEIDGYYMDQFTFAERATDWRGNNNIAQSIFEQMSKESHPVPEWVVMSAGTGGTSATIGRYIRYQKLPSKLLVVDPEHSVFYDYYQTNHSGLTADKASRIEGIGRPRVEPSFVPGVIDEMLKVPDSASIAAMHWISNKLGRKVGPSTGTNICGVLHCVEQMIKNRQKGSIVTLLCDSGERYLNSYYDADWVENNIGDLTSHTNYLSNFY